MDRLEAMAAFVAVVEAGGFSAASRRMGIPLTTVSRRVSDLEDELRAQLLVRSTRSVALTDAGGPYFETCRRVLEDVAEAERRASGEYRAPRGTLAVSAPVVFGRLHLAPLIVEFLKAYPEVDVDLRLSDAVSHLIEEQTDVALRIGALPDSGLMAARVGEIRHVACASPAYLAARGEPQTPGDLSQHDCISFTVLQSATEWQFAHGAQTGRVPVHSRLTVSTAEAAVDAAVAGLGVVQLLCYQVAAAIADGRLRLLLRAFEPPRRPVHLVYPANRIVPHKLRAFMEFVLPRLRARIVFDG